MKIYDISKELFSSKVFFGDPSPKRIRLYSMEKGSMYNLSAVSMCVHNATHVDAPSHFIEDGANIEEIPLYKAVGMAYVAVHSGMVGKEDAKEILQKAKAVGGDCEKRILIKGDAWISEEAANVFADAGIYLLGNESPTVGPENAPMAVHKILLGKDVVLLESIVLTDVSQGKYFLGAAPLKLGGCEGAPCRAFLAEI